MCYLCDDSDSAEGYESYFENELYHKDSHDCFYLGKVLKLESNEPSFFKPGDKYSSAKSSVIHEPSAAHYVRGPSTFRYVHDNFSKTFSSTLLISKLSPS
jgi:hypothetical protein